ncbi:hypothetical protein L0F63_003895 [Massospora cicadina]|nr:hypothetical protein L0F63_003895 [Massospora cicadina]
MTPVIELAYGVLTVVNGKSTQCDSPFYCNGKILKVIQMSRVLEDGKEFVDRPTKFPAVDVVKNFNKLKDHHVKTLKEFVNNNFHDAGYELEEVKLANFNKNPEFLTKIKNPVFKGFAKQIHGLWGTLIRKANNKLCTECVTSLLPTKHNFVVPGGRFREFYYWDSFFSLEGLNLGGLLDVSKAMILNLLDFVEAYGFVPNGARIYFLNRSQPPLLTQMVKSYLRASKDTSFLTQHIATLDKEYRYWMDHHSVFVSGGRGKQYRLNRYVVNNKEPRPESYREDINTVNTTKNSDKQRIYADLAAGAESGWDFSARWIPTTYNKRQFTSQEVMLQGIRTSDIIPVDLNAILYANERALFEFHTRLFRANACAHHHRRRANAYAHHHQRRADACVHHRNMIKSYRKAYKKRAKAMAYVLWHREDQSFYDYNFEKNSLRREFFASNLWPFWAGAIDGSIKKNLSNLVAPFEAIKRFRESAPAGIPTSEVKGSLLQWDYPNSWAPLEYVIVEGALKVGRLLKSKDKDLSRRAYKVGRETARNYIRTTFCAWYNSGGEVKGLLNRKSGVKKGMHGNMYEKYDVRKVGGFGGGGEYQLQTGFGWTNGVLIHLLAKFPKSFKSKLPQKICRKR